MLVRRHKTYYKSSHRPIPSQFPSHTHHYVPHPTKVLGRGPCPPRNLGGTEGHPPRCAAEPGGPGGLRVDRWIFMGESMMNAKVVSTQWISGLECRSINGSVVCRSHALHPVVHQPGQVSEAFATRGGMQQSLPQSISVRPETRRPPGVKGQPRQI